ncbi:unnamed protein product [Periconia digitata]|uniref:Uncharacterized protein n=1 Tax=Periconia digitata TaxID=1303443 RepID=A0A9W4UNJ9_9PLEO|nr:unnamed protein product [Periconia digitata]
MAKAQPCNPLATPMQQQWNLLMTGFPIRWQEELAAVRYTVLGYRPRHPKSDPRPPPIPMWRSLFYFWDQMDVRALSTIQESSPPNFLKLGPTLVRDNTAYALRTQYCSIRLRVSLRPYD